MDDNPQTDIDFSKEINTLVCQRLLIQLTLCVIDKTTKE